MPTLSVSAVRSQDITPFSNAAAEFILQLDAPVTTLTAIPINFVSGTTPGGYAERHGFAYIRPGQDSTTIEFGNIDDEETEPGQTFSLVVPRPVGIDLEGGAAALIVPNTIRDPDGLTLTEPGPVQKIMGPASASISKPTVQVHDTVLIEGDGLNVNSYFLATLDAPATTRVGVKYYYQPVSAEEDTDFGSVGFQNLWFNPGEQAVVMGLPNFGDTEIEASETFELVFVEQNGVVFPGNAASYKATVTILDDDAGPFFSLLGTGGIGGPGDRIYGPTSASDSLPTLRAYSPILMEVDEGDQMVKILLTLDRPSTEPVFGNVSIFDGLASLGGGDYGKLDSYFSFRPGTTSTTVMFPVYGDTRPELHETFSVAFTDLNNAVFEDAAPALISTVTIYDNDLVELPEGDAGIGRRAAGVEAPEDTSPLLPTVHVFDVSIVEGPEGTDPLISFLYALDRPTEEIISIDYTFSDVSGLAYHDHNGANGGALHSRDPVYIAAGEMSGVVQVAIYGDNLPEDDESFLLVLGNIKNARFPGDAPMMVATGTIIDDDDGNPLIAAGLGDPGRLIARPPASEDGVVIRVVDASVAEHDDSGTVVNVYLVPSEPATEEIPLRFELVGVSATPDVDVDIPLSSGRNLPIGWDGGWVTLFINADDLDEGDETFDLVFSSTTGASFEDGKNTARVTIRDDDGSGTAGDPATGPQFIYADVSPRGNNLLNGDAEPDDLSGGDGDDTLSGLAGKDTLNGGAGQDALYGGTGNDDIQGGNNDDLVDGGEGDDLLRGGKGDDVIHGGDGDDIVRGQARDDEAYGGAGDDNIKGGNGIDTLDGGAGNDFLKGGTKSDLVIGGEGHDKLFGNSFNDTLRGGAGNDKLNGGGDDDVLEGGSGRDNLKGGDGDDVFIFDTGHGSDRIIDFDLADDTLQISAELADGMSAAQISASAQVVSGGVLIDFGSGDEILLRGFDSTAGFAAAIEVV